MEREERREERGREERRERKREATASAKKPSPPFLSGPSSSFRSLQPREIAERTHPLFFPLLPLLYPTPPSQVEQAAEAVRDKASDFGGKVSSMAGSAGEKAKDAAASAKDSAGETMEKTKDAAGYAKDQTASEIEQQRHSAAGSSFLVFLVFSFSFSLSLHSFSSF